MKVIIRNIEPELIFDIKGIRLYRYKYPHFGYFDWSGLAKTSTKRSNLYRYSRRCCSDYIYRLCISKEGMDNLHDDIDEYNIHKVTGQNVSDLKHLLRDDSITFTDLNNGEHSFAYYKQSDYHNDPVLTDLELQRKRIADKDKLLKSLFSNALIGLGEKYGFEFRGFDNGSAIVNWYYGDNFFTKEIEKLINNTIVKDLNELGFDCNVDMYDIKTAFSGGAIYSIEAKNDLFEKEKADESDNKRGEN